MNKFYFYFAVIGSLTYVLWGYVVTEVNEGILVDSFSHRLLVMLPLFGLISYNFITKKINFEYLAYAGILFITTDYCFLIAINNRTIHTTGLYVVLTASLAVINKRWFLWLYSVLFTAYCIFSISIVAQTTLEKAHWGNMLTLIALMTFFGIWRIRNMEQLETEYRSNIQKSKKLEELNNIAAQVAHDIRSPVMALENFARNVSNVEPSKLKIVSDAANRVNGIADYLLNEYRKRFAQALEPLENTNKNIFDKQTVSELIQSLKEEKLLLQSEFRTFKILIHGDIQYKISEPTLQFELKRVISNIINNSIEAFEDTNGVIDLMLSETEASFSIQIKDNGLGIPKHLLEKIFVRGSTFNKKGGTGLGLSYAKETIEKFNGNIDLSSKLNFGTLVQITIPKS